jgi:hypothetical protein
MVSSDNRRKQQQFGYAPSGWDCGQAVTQPKRSPESTAILGKVSGISVNAHPLGAPLDGEILFETKCSYCAGLQVTGTKIPSLDILKSTHLGKSGDNLSGRQSAFGTIQSGRTRYFLECTRKSVQVGGCSTAMVGLTNPGSP